MKKLVLCRHAKSSWKYDVDDVYRPLNKRGLDNAPAMARHWRGKTPDVILCSPAIRTYATALAYIHENTWPLALIHLQQALFEANLDILMSTLTALDTFEKNSNILLIGHNPGLELLADYLNLSDVGPIITSASVEFELAIDHWQELYRGCASSMKITTPDSIVL